MNLASGKVYKINNTEVLSGTTLGSNVVNSSLTSVGTLGELVVSGVTTSSGGFVGDLTGNAFDGTGNVDLGLTLATVNSDVGSYGSTTQIPVVTVNAKGLVTAVSTASVGTALTVTSDSGSEDIDLLTESLAITGGSNITGTASANGVELALDSNITLTSVTANLTGDVTGDVTGDLTGNVTGNVTGDVTGDLTGNVTGNVTGDVTGNADTATALETARNFSASGDASASAVSFDGTGNVDLALTLATVNSDVGSYGSTTQIPVVTVNAKGLVTAVSTASVGTALTVTSDSGSEDIDLLTESLAITGGANITGTASANGVELALDDNITLTSVTADLTGDVTGNADTATAWATARDLSLTGDGTATLSSVDGTANVSAALTLATVNSDTGSFGSSTTIPVVTVNAKGLVTAVSTASVGTALTVTGDSGSEVIDLLTESH
jgi:hypothetical protein